VFAIDNEKSLQSAKEVWVPEVRQILPNNIPIILVGTKSDKRPVNDGGVGTPTFGRQLISKAAAQKAGKSIKGVVCTMECSSRTQSGLHAVFDAAIRAAVAHRAAAAKKTPHRRRRCTVS
jgi:GTPase SAR1 family protein